MPAKEHKTATLNLVTCIFTPIWIMLSNAPSIRTGEPQLVLERGNFNKQSFSSHFRSHCLKHSGIKRKCRYYFLLMPPCFYLAFLIIKCLHTIKVKVILHHAMQSFINSVNHHFLLFPQCFLPFKKTYFNV